MKLAGTLALAGGGGKKLAAKRLALSRLSFTLISVPCLSLIRRVGILGLPPQGVSGMLIRDPG